MAIITVTGGNSIEAAFDVSFYVMSAADPYVITGSGTTFTATRGTVIGTADQPIQDVINAIRTAGSGAARTIQFGDGEDALDIGANTVSFNNTGGTWTNPVTLTGAMNRRITIEGNVSVNSTADLSGGVTHSSTGTLNISGGYVRVGNNYSIALDIYGTGKVTVSGTASVWSRTNSSNSPVTGESPPQYPTIFIRDNGTSTDVRLEITGGTVSLPCDSTAGKLYATRNVGRGTYLKTVWNNGPGTINITGGTVSATWGNALFISNGKVIVSGSPVISSTGDGVNRATVYIPTYATGTDLLDVQSGTISNNAGYAIMTYGGSSRARVKRSGPVISGEVYGVTNY